MYDKPYIVYYLTNKNIQKYKRNFILNNHKTKFIFICFPKHFDDHI